MNVQIESSGPCRRHLRIEIPAERVSKEMSGVVDAYLQYAKIPGFRPGKAPRAMVAKRYQKQIQQEVKERMVPEAYQTAIKDQNLRPVAVIDVDEPVVTADAPFVFNVVVDVQPEFDMPAYKSITVTPQRVTVEDERVEEVLNNLRDRNAKYEDAAEDAVAGAGDLVSIDSEATLEGKPLAETIPELKELSSGKDFWLFADDEQFLLKDLSKGLVGLKKGDQTAISVTFPDSFPNEAARGKSADFAVTVKAIRSKVLPPVDEAFLKDLQVESLDQLKDRIREDLMRMKEDQEKQRQRGELVRKLLDAVSMDLPESVVQQETSRTVYDIVQENARRGVSNDEIEANRDQIFQAATRNAEEQVKLKFILLRIAEAEKIEVADPEVESRIRAMAQATRRDPAKLREDFVKDGGQGWTRLKERMTQDKALDAVMATAAPGQEA